ncbi:phage tail protein [Pseudomonas sp. FSL R10-0399]|uniref:phage tail-collar fiber domain-containing protein n=1 Tax=Pseudomonas sp. FSL R10-0399 TaxID=2662194 RepID=UPI0013296422|nr:phage tail protein [Pseudomonas sp. FSL R10-0399]
MGASITLAGESLIAQKVGAQQSLIVSRFVLANVPGLDPNSAVNRAAPKPPAGQIVATYDVTQKGFVNPNQVVYSLMMGSDIGDFDWNWIGLETAENVLLAVAYVPVQQKRRNIPPLQLGNNVTRNFLVVFDGAQALTGITIDASTWQHDFTVRLNGIDERERLSNRDMFGRACFFGTGLQLEKVGAGYQLKPGLAYVEGVRLHLPAAKPVAVPSVPNKVWLDVVLQRELSDVVSTFTVVFGADKADYSDSSGARHYLVPLADLVSSSVTQDLRAVEPINTELVKHFAARTGDYSGLRARATTKGDVGLDQIPNAISDDDNSNSSLILATTKAVNVVRNVFTKALSALGEQLQKNINGKPDRDFITAVGLVAGDTRYPYVRVEASGELLHLARGDHGHKYSDLGDKPTTLGGYGITDAYTKTKTDELLNLRVFRDGISYVGLVSGDERYPYMRSEVSNGLIKLARADHGHTFADLGGKPTTLGGFGITDAYTMVRTDALLAQRVASDGILDAGLANGNPSAPYFRDAKTNAVIIMALASHKHAFGELTDLPPTLAQHGITDAYTIAQTDQRLANKINRDWIDDAGLVSNNPDLPYMRQSSTGELVPLVSSAQLPRNTTVQGVPGWWRCGDTGQIRQRVSVAIGDLQGSWVGSVAWPIAFPWGCDSVSLTFRQTAASPTCVSAAYFNEGRAGCSLRVDEWGNITQSGALTVIIEATGY